MELVIYVHDFTLEIGHSNAMIELCRNIDFKKISRIEVVSYTCSPPPIIFPHAPDLCQKLHHKKIPFQKIYPSLLKSMFYHLCSAFYYFHKKAYAPNSVHISIGAASLLADIVNIQFVHAQWNPLFFKHLKMPPLRWIYKKIAYSYFAWTEKVFFLNPNTKFFALSDFVKNYCQQKFNIPDSHISTIYSGVNLTRFKPTTETKSEIIKKLIIEYPQLKVIDLKRPIILFVGAFERKGLPQLNQWLKQFPQLQLLAIGVSEQSRRSIFPVEFTSCHIAFTDRVATFYDLADAFIFPSLYDPFGLVVLEAYAKGLPLFTYKNNIGASELILGQAEVYFFEEADIINYLRQLTPLALRARQQIQRQRHPHLATVNWQNSAEKFLKICQQTQTMRSA